MENLSQGKENMLRPEEKALVMENEKHLFLDNERSLFPEMENALVLEQEKVLVTDKENALVLEDENPPETELCLTNKVSSEAYCESSPSNSSQLETSPSNTIVGSVSNDGNSQLGTPPSSSAIAPVSSSAGDDPVKKALYKFGQRTSKYRGVTRHRWTGKYEAHLWDNTTVSETRKRKGKQVYLGGYETEEKAAVAYDLAALKFWGTSGHSKLNFPVSRYEKEVEEMQDMSREEYINSLRRQSICFARGNSNYRGVTRQHEGRRWQARIGRVAGGRDIYLGTYDTEEEAAEAYDIAAVKLRGMNAITNFHISNYYKEGSKELDILPIKPEEERAPPPTVTVRRFRMSTT